MTNIPLNLSSALNLAWDWTSRRESSCWLNMATPKIPCKTYQQKTKGFWANSWETNTIPISTCSTDIPRMRDHSTQCWTLTTLTTQTHMISLWGEKRSPVGLKESMSLSSWLRELQLIISQSRPSRSTLTPSSMVLLPMVDAELVWKEWLSCTAVFTTSESVHCSQETLRDSDPDLFLLRRL